MTQAPPLAVPAPAAAPAAKRVPGERGSAASAEQVGEAFDTALALEGIPPDGPGPPGADPPTEESSARTALAEGAQIGSDARSSAARARAATPVEAPHPAPDSSPAPAPSAASAAASVAQSTVELGASNVSPALERPGTTTQAQPGSEPASVARTQSGGALTLAHPDAAAAHVPEAPAQSAEPDGDGGLPLANPPRGALRAAPATGEGAAPTATAPAPSSAPAPAPAPAPEDSAQKNAVAPATTATGEAANGAPLTELAATTPAEPASGSAASGAATNGSSAPGATTVAEPRGAPAPDGGRALQPEGQTAATARDVAAQPTTTTTAKQPEEATARHQAPVDTAPTSRESRAAEQQRPDAPVQPPTLAALGRQAGSETRPETSTSHAQPSPVAAPEAGASETRAFEAPRASNEMPRLHARLHDAGARTEAAIRLAVRDGHAFARITMRPAELGSIEIRLAYRGNEIIAEVRAESQQTLNVLSQTASDLRRQLEAQGITLGDLQLKHSNKDDARDGERTGGSDNDRRSDGSEHPIDDPDELAIEAAGRHPSAVRLDVLA